jgi:polyhydroxyalkanoate synthesis regulator phasin
MGDSYNIENLSNVEGLQMGADGIQVNYFGARAEQRRLVEELIRQARSHSRELAAPDVLTSTAAELDTELDREEPREGRLRDLLGKLTMAAGGVTAVAEAVDKLRQAIGLDG